MGKLFAPQERVLTDPCRERQFVCPSAAQSCRPVPPEGGQTEQKLGLPNLIKLGWQLDYSSGPDSARGDNFESASRFPVSH
jgi:hypothetical protein